MSNVSGHLCQSKSIDTKFNTGRYSKQMCMNLFTFIPYIVCIKYVIVNS